MKIIKKSSLWLLISYYAIVIKVLLLNALMMNQGPAIVIG